MHHVATPFQEVCIYVNVAGSKQVRAQHRLRARQCKDWHGLHESSYCYHMTYVGTCNPKQQDSYIRVTYGSLGERDQDFNGQNRP